ncbi:MAG: hypothetical protein A3E83_00885 [Gammaproteobacteria bacterium RIFCSPHIGHO2_12_FULL_41_20]|nr:MAG: hypothetical protein A3E83_00885 [Gammaproteobacteria bacterium RIFCSPHIGHO2_12_FULL_41_20]
MNIANKKLHPWMPVYWPIWFFLGILWLITRLPYNMQLSIGKNIGQFLYFLPSKLRSTATVNIRLCFPSLTAEQQQQLIKKNFDSLGIGVIETAMAWWLPDAKLQSLLHISGIEHAEQALAQNKGVILLSPHFTCLEMMGRLIGMRYQFTAMYRPHKSPIINHIQSRFRQRYGINYIPRHKMRLLLHALTKNQPIWYAYDVDGGRQRSVFAPFFNIPTASLTAVSRITKSTGALVVPIHFYRRDDNTGYQIQFSPALEQFPSSDWVKDATRLNAALEKAIRNTPEQYIWQYKRFKTRPLGEARVY